MAEVFINYRTGDGDEAAELIAHYLSQRFENKHVFKAPRSIRPGEAFPQALVSAARECMVLLAVMGPDWARAPRLRDEDDWVRREILEAHASGARVIPVLKGRRTERLVRDDLPLELKWLADVNSLRLDVHESTADLDRIGKSLTELVPSLLAADKVQGSSQAAANTANGTSAPVTRTGPVTGNVNVFGTTYGPVHTGKGDIHLGAVLLPEATAGE